MAKLASIASLRRDTETATLLRTTPARAHRVVWRSVRPRWAEALDEALARRPSLGLVAVAEEDALTLLGGVASRRVAASSSGLELASTYAPAPSEAQAMSLWHRMMLSQDLQPDDAWFVRLASIHDDGESGAAGEGVRLGAWPNMARHDEGLAS